MSLFDSYHNSRIYIKWIITCTVINFILKDMNEGTCCFDAVLLKNSEVFQKIKEEQYVVGDVPSNHIGLLRT